MHRYAILAFLMLAGILAVLVWAASLGPQSECVVIDSPGNYYLNTSITGANYTTSDGPACIWIRSSDVNFDCKGYSITNDATPGAIGIFVEGPVSNVRVENCNVNDYTFNIFDKTVTNSVFSNNIATTSFFGMGDYGQCIGFTSVGSGSNRYENNLASRCFKSFDLRASSGHVFTNNKANHSQNGFHIEMSSENNISDNNIYGTLVGIEIYSSGFNNFKKNNISNVLGYAVASQSGDNNFEDNIIQDSGGGFDLAYGPYVLSNNKLFNLNSGYGIQLKEGTDNSILDSNEIFNMTGEFNITEGETFAFDAVNIRSTHNTITGNIIHDSKGTGIGMNAGYNNVIENLVYNIGGIGIYIIQGEGLGNDTPLGNNMLSGNTLHDIKGGDCFELFSSSENTITGNTCYKSNGGFLLEVGSNNYLSNNTIYQGDGVGMEIRGNHDSKIINNTAFDIEMGLTIDGGTNNLVSENSLYDNLFGGMLLIGATGTTVVDNTVHGSNLGPHLFNLESAGIILTAGSKNNVLKNNNIYNNTMGIELRPFALAPELMGPSDNIINFNKISNNSNYGIYVDSSNNNKFSNNEISGQRTGNGTYIKNSTGIILENEHFYRNSNDFFINATRVVDTKLIKVVFDAPAGKYENYTMLSINDTLKAVDSYSIRWAQNSTTTKIPTGTFTLKKFVNMSTSYPYLEIDSIFWHWTDKDVQDADEKSIQLWSYNNTWNLENSTLNITTNSLNISNVNASFYGLVYATPRAADCRYVTISINFTAACEGNNVIVIAGESPLSLANVTIIREGGVIASGLTDSAGKFIFNGTGQNADMYVEKNRTPDTCYSVPGAGKFTINLKNPADCGRPECTVNSDCPSGQVCTSNKCVITTAPECTKDADCASGKVCTNGKCVEKQPPTGEGCTSDDNCTADQFCSAGSCTPVATGACGHIVNHAWVSYECCADADCTEEQRCQDNKCTITAPLYDLIGPNSSIVWDNITFTAYHNSQPMENAQLKMIKPDGSFNFLSTDSSGEISFNLTQEGTYNIDLLVNYTAVKTSSVVSLPKTTFGIPVSLEVLAGTGLLLVFLVTVAGVLAYLVYYFFGGKAKIKKRRK